MRELKFDSTWSSELRKIHLEHQQFADFRAQPNVFSWYRQRTAKIASLLSKFAPGAQHLLDIGCAQGTIAITLAEAGYTVTGNDIRESYLSYARMRDESKLVNFICDNFIDYKPPRKFDAVIFTEVIEHIIDHAPFLKHIFECLTSNGILIVTTPNFDYIRQPLPSYAKVKFEENKEKEFSANGSDHFYMFSKVELTGLLISAGFEILEHKYYLPFLQDGICKLRLLWRIFPARMMEAVSRPFEGSRTLCAQQYVVARRPGGPL